MEGLFIMSVYSSIFLNKFKYDEEDLNFQRKCYLLFNKVMDAILCIKYDAVKKRNTFYSLEQINTIFLNLFESIFPADIHHFVIPGYIILDLIKATRRYGSEMYYINKIKMLYNSYIENNGNIPRNISTPFYKEILNDEKEYYMHFYKNELVNQLKGHIPINKNKLREIKNRKKIKYIESKLKKHCFSEINVTKEDILKDLEDIHKNLNQIKLLRRAGIFIREEQFFDLDCLFLDGQLNYENVCQLNFTADYSSPIIKKIIGKYYKVLLPYIDYISDDLFEIDPFEICFRYNYFNVFDLESFQTNFNSFLSTLNDNELKYLLENYSRLQELFALLPFLHLLKEFDISIFKSIIFNFDTISDILIRRGRIKENYTFEQLFNHLKEVIILAKTYLLSNSYIQSILTYPFIDTVVTQNLLVDSNLLHYVNIYIEMLKQPNTYLPPIEGYYQNYVFESGNNYDLEKLLLGKYVYGSCIDFNREGEETYKMVLLHKNCDVLMIKDKDTLDFYARILLFRKGNSIFMAPIMGSDGIGNNNLWSESFLNLIHDLFIEKAESLGDVIENVLITYDFMDKKLDYPSVTLKGVSQVLPHSDFTDQFYLITTCISDSTLDFSDKRITVCYEKKRKKVCKYEKNFIDHMLKIKALEMFMESDFVKSEKIQFEYETISSTHYAFSYIGQDFYVAIREDGQIETCLLNTHDKRQDSEFFSVIDLLDGDLAKTEKFDREDFFGKVLKIDKSS